jgi:hypothetical protein
LERVWLDVDWDCRKDHSDTTLMRLEPGLEQFATVHDDELLAMSQVWEGIEDEARAHGWTPGDIDFGPPVPEIPAWPTKPTPT